MPRGCPLLLVFKDILTNYAISMKYLAGFGKAEMTCFIPGVGMMGYGQVHNTVKVVGTPLFARTMVLVESHQYFILVHLEQAFVTMAIKEEILKRLQDQKPEWSITDANLMITAQHTHSAPGGYGHYPFYNFTIPGFQLRVFKTICDGIMDSIHQASSHREEVQLKWGSHAISPEKEVAFNRSMHAYLKNKDVEVIEPENKALGVNRTMEGLTITNSLGDLKGLINWFGVHCTSISSFNHRIHSDNKGVAATLFENQYPGSTAFFMQAAAGDVSPNFILDKETGLMRGKFKDQYECAEFNGEIQFRESEKVQPNLNIQGGMNFFHQFVDMSVRVAPAAHGVAFFEGTAEGPGVSKALGQVLRVLARGVKAKSLLKDPAHNKAFYEAHYPKDILLDHRSGSFIGLPLNLWKKLPKIPEASIEALRKAAGAEAINTLPWVPHIIPVQLIVLGNLLIAAVPGEITTTSAKRLKEMLEKEVQGKNIDRIIISSYANAFMGYITTPEEYMTQSYEAGHTIYGRNTLKGILDSFQELAQAFVKDKSFTSLIPAPFHFPANELKRRSVD
jgi:neutral ceramidase